MTKIRSILGRLFNLVPCLAAMLVLAVMLAGCGAPLADVTAIGTDAAILITEALPTYETANPSDAKQAAANAQILLADDQKAIADAQAMPSTEQVILDAEAVLKIIGEIMPMITPFLGETHPAMTASKHEAFNAKLADLRARLAVIRSHQKK
jgi:hypothetical protein